MNFCTLDDAFQPIGGAPSPGCRDDDATRAARREERRKARRCKGPAATYLDIEDKDPDRQTWTKAPEVPPMNAQTGLREHHPVTAPQGEEEPFQDHSAIPDNSYIKPMKSAPKKSFFGAQGPDDESYADYVPDQDHYQLTPDFQDAFAHAGVGRAGSSAALPIPSVNMYWKPTLPNGAQTSYIDHLPPPGGKYYHPPTKTEISMDQVMKRMDQWFARLDDMNSAGSSSPEQMTSEILMFGSSGIFVLFLMDLMVKKGSTLRF